MSSPSVDFDLSAYTMQSPDSPHPPKTPIISTRMPALARATRSTGSTYGDSDGYNADDAPLAKSIPFIPAQRHHASDASLHSRPTASRSSAPDASGQPLIEVIERKQGTYVDNKETINKTRFGQNGQPLVPLTAKDLQSVPGADISKFAPPKTNKDTGPKYPRCANCGCTDFAPTPFRKTSCANCFHTH